MHISVTRAVAMSPIGAAVMPYRVYVRWPRQQTTDKTVTDSLAVAELAYEELQVVVQTLREKGAIGIAFTKDNKQLRYVELRQGPTDSTLMGDTSNKVD